MSSESQYVTPAGLQAMGIEYSRQWLHALEQRGEFPKRLYYSARRFHWPRADIEKWLAERHATAQPTMPPVIDPFKGRTRPQAPANSIRQGDHDEQSALA